MRTHSVKFFICLLFQPIDPGFFNGTGGFLLFQHKKKDRCFERGDSAWNVITAPALCDGAFKNPSRVIASGEPGGRDEARMNVRFFLNISPEPENQQKMPKDLNVRRGLVPDLFAPP